MKSEVRSPKSEFRKPKPEIRKSLSERFLSLLIFVLFLACGGSARAATIEGTVFDPGGGAVAGARVSLMAPLIPLAEREADSQGQYRFEGVRAGVYTLVADAPGLSTSTIGVRLENGQTRIIDLRLKLSAVEQRVVVSASLGGALAPEIGSSVSVITQKEIDDRGAQSVLDVLRGTPGVEVNQTGRRGGVTGVFIRGGNSNYNLVMIDGIPVNQFGGDFDFAPLPADGVDHIEVTRGPESALYGSNAVTGVVNIVSRSGEGPPHITALAEGGSFTTRRFATSGSGLTHGLGWAYDLSRLDSGGVVTNDRYRTQSAFLSLGYSRSPRRQVNFHFFGDANDAGAPGPFGSDPDRLFAGIDTISRDKQNLFGFEGSYAEQLSSHFRQVVAGSVATNDYYFKSPFGDSYSNNLRGVFNTRSEWTVSSKDFLVAGFEYNREQTRNTFIADSNSNPFLLPRTSLAYFVENRWNPSRQWFVNAGLRVDDLRTHSLPPGAFGSRPFLPASSITKVNPRASVAYLAREGIGGTWLGATRLHGSFGTGIRAASGFELAFTNNPVLKPEKSVSFDAGVEQRFYSDRAVLDLTYFYNRFEDQIVTLGGSLTNLSTFTSANLGNARAQGAELSFRFRPTRSLQVQTEYTLLDTSILALENTSIALSPFRVGQPLPRRPRNSAFYNVTWEHGRWMLNTDAYFRGRVFDLEPNDSTFACVLGLPCFFYNHGYTRADAGFAYRLPRGVEVYGRLNNFLNQKYEESFGFPALHLNFVAGIKLNFPSE
jgi:outer membrane receptor protein involved in Fe transport